jgi:hypothetical protein
MKTGVMLMSFRSPKEFYEKFKHDPEAARTTAFEIGKEIGDALLRNLCIQGNDLETLAKVLNEFQRNVQGEPSAKAEGNRVMMQCSGLCPIMRAALTLNIPWEWLDTNYAWPMIEGIASHIVPDIKLRMLSTKSRGDSACVYVFETHRDENRCRT